MITGSYRQNGQWYNETESICDQWIWMTCVIMSSRMINKFNTCTTPQYPWAACSLAWRAIMGPSCLLAEISPCCASPTVKLCQKLVTYGPATWWGYSSNNYTHTTTLYRLKMAEPRNENTNRITHHLREKTKG